MNRITPNNANGGSNTLSMPNPPLSPTSSSKKNYNLVKSVQDYITKMISEPSGMKVLLLDTETTSIVSCSCTQSYLLSKEVYLVDRLENKSREKMTHLKCVVFTRPTNESINLICQELKNPNYGVYYLYFSNALKKTNLEKLAEADVHEIVKEVQECFADYLSINANLFSLGLQVPDWPLLKDSSSNWNPFSLQRTIEGLAAVLLSIKRKPVLRYASTTLCQRLAYELNHFVSVAEPTLFEKNSPINVLILDRQQDVVTPLLTPWTYQAMLHELLSIEKGLIDLSHVPDVKPDMKQVALSQDDPFYISNMYHNFGELGFSIKSYLQEFQQKSHIKSNLESLADMKKFIEAYPEFKKLSGNVTKHVMLTGELSRTVDTYQLLHTSEIEQNIACSDKDQSEAILEAFNSPIFNEDSKLKLMLLYALKNKDKSISTVYQRFQTSVSPFKAKLVDLVLKYAKGEKTNSSSSSPLKLDKMALMGLGKSVMKGLKGVENVYTQYTPPLLEILELYSKGKLKESLYPFINDGSDSVRNLQGDIIVFFIGGTTYEEARFAHQFQSSSPGMQVFIGGHTIHNSQSFLKQIHDTFTNQVQNPM
ncbi:hypothetical protein HMI54_013174 [Coelomomyces lativittatus]|nr:hypothetical protein HMI55_006421 [Coelomomyces lativittatus]KAJ1514937.1 hypothetical protein HMI54_013174 [Coelomomyces lativittatus]KAJ1514984.1 hypothetical protein HMI56_006948 [Coelomomyces lativittatus]